MIYQLSVLFHLQTGDPCEHLQKKKKKKKTKKPTPNQTAPFLHQMPSW